LFQPDEYAQQFRQYAVYFKRMGMNQGLELVGVGHSAPDWNPKFLAALGGGLPYLDHLSIHRYFRRGHSTQFTDNDYRGLMTDLVPFEQLIRDSIRAIEAVEPQRSKIPVFGRLKPRPVGLVIDEWGVWHDDATIDDGFAQNGTQRDAVFAAACLNLFHRFAERITMTNIAQVMNCLHSLILTRGARLALTPTFHVYEMYQPHYRATSLRVAAESGESLTAGDRAVPTVSSSASKSQNELLLTLANLHPSGATDVKIGLRGGRAASARATVLAAESPHAQNTVDQPQAVMPKEAPAELSGDTVRIALPPCSVAAVRLRLA
jgi:alpha-N-arabinofuranosidase